MTAPELQSKFSFYNTMGRSLVPFSPIKSGEVSIYCCGPTVYNYQHIGNMRTYISQDVLTRTLRYAGFKVNHVMNITDVGHLVSDADEGEDKMQVAAKRENKKSMEIAEFYMKAFFDDCIKLNIKRPSVVCRATEHIQEMIDVIQALIQKGVAYQNGGNVYFSVDKFPAYGKLANLSLEALIAGARVDVDPLKKNPSDFALWFTKSKFEGQELQWESPWGRGYPGWHIECSAMAMKYLGERIDIHCGGVDHIGVHHTNEIAQSEACIGHDWVNLWLHSEFLIDSDGKMSKSKGSFLTLSKLEEDGFSALDYRYLCLGSHYRTELKFSNNALQGAKNSLIKIHRAVEALQTENAAEEDAELSAEGREILETFHASLTSDLNTPRSLAALHNTLNSQTLSKNEKFQLIKVFDSILALNMSGASAQKADIPSEIKDLADQRVAAKMNKDWKLADELRAKIENSGYAVEDSKGGYKLSKK